VSNQKIWLDLKAKAAWKRLSLICITRKNSVPMKAKIFEVVLRKLPSGKSPATALEEQLNNFLVERPQLRLMATHMSTLVSPAEPDAMPRSEESSIVIFCTLFYTE